MSINSDKNKELMQSESDKLVSLIREIVK